MITFPTPASAFIDAMTAAAEADRRDPRPHGTGRWAALALVPALLVAAVWML